MSAVTVEAPDELAKVVTEIDLAIDGVDLESVVDHNLTEVADRIAKIAYLIVCEGGHGKTTDDIRQAMTKLGPLLDAKDKLNQR